jgi:hypothetical protein
MTDKKVLTDGNPRHRAASPREQQSQRRTHRGVLGEKILVEADAFNPPRRQTRRPRESNNFNLVKT